MMKIGFFLIFSLFFGQAFAQKTVFGKIVDSEGTPVFAANVYWKKMPQNGTISDFEGNFGLKIHTLPDTLTVSFVGYETQNVLVKTVQDTLKIVLQRTDGLLSEIVIRGTTPISEAFSVVKLDKMQIYSNPVAAADALKALTLLPASSTTDESANPNLRGSPSESTRVLLNGVPIYNPVRNSQLNGLGNFSLFNTEIVHKLYLYPSNPPLTFGNMGAGLVEIESIPELPANNLQISLSLANVGLFWSKKLSKRNFLQVYSNRQFSEAFLAVNRPNLPRLIDFRTQDAGLNMRIHIGKNTYWNSFTYGIDESFEYQNHAYTYEGRNLAGKQRAFTVNNLVKKWERSNLKINNLIDISRQNYAFGNLSSTIWRKQIYTSVDYKFFPLTNLSLQTGANYEYANYEAQDSIPQFYFAVSPQSPRFYQETQQTKHQAEMYAFQNWEINEKWQFSSGLRLNVPVQSQKFYVSHQASLVYRPSSSQRYLLSTGAYHFYFAPNYTNPQFTLLNSRQVALDYFFSKKNTNLTAAIYYKKEEGKIRTFPVDQSDVTETLGLELAWQQTFGKYFSLSASQTFMSQTLQSEGNYFPSNAIAGSFSKVLLSFQHPKIANFSISYMGRTGTRFTPITGANYRADLGFYEPIRSEALNSAMYGNYHNVGFNVNRYLSYSKMVFVLFASVNNLLNTPNEKSLIYTPDYASAIAENYQLRTIYFGMVIQFLSKK